MNQRIQRALLIAVLSLGMASGAPASLPTRPAAPMVGVTIADVLKRHEELQAFRVAMYETRLARLLARPGTYTVFAPTNDAFTVVADEDLDDVAGLIARQRLGRFVLRGAMTPRVLKEMLLARGGQMNLPNLAGGVLSFTLDDRDAIVLEGVARLGEEEIAANGVLIPINRVLPAPPPRTPAREF